MFDVRIVKHPRVAIGMVCVGVVCFTCFSMMYLLPESQVGDGASANLLGRQVGGALGLAVIGRSSRRSTRRKSRERRD
jgi:hypothetical protein